MHGGNMIRTRQLENTEENRIYFNGYLASVPKGTVFQSWEWGEVKGATGWEPFYLIAEEEGCPVGALMILKRRIPFPGKSFFYAPRGPVMDIGRDDVLDSLLEKAAELAAAHGAIFLKLDPDVPSSETDFTDMLKKKGFRDASTGEGFDGVQPRYVFRLDITPDEDRLMADMHNKTRYNIRLAGRKGVVIHHPCGKEMLPAFYEILTETCERDGFLVRSYSYFEEIWDRMAGNGMAELYMAEADGKWIAGTLTFVFGDKTWYIYGASSNAYRNYMPNYLIQWTMIRRAKECGSSVYDFRGVPGKLTEDNPLYGLYRFKKGFNGVYTEFAGEFDLAYSPLLYFAWKYLLPFYQKNVRRLIRFRKNRGGAKK